MASITGRIATGPHAGARVQTGGDRVDPESLEATPSERCARVSGFSVHANVAVSAGDRKRLERLCRYVARPPLASERLEMTPDGRLVYEFKRPWRNGISRAFYSPLEFIEKLSALVPPPRAHLARYHGVLAPAAKWRAKIVPRAEMQTAPDFAAPQRSSAPEVSMRDPQREPKGSAPPLRHPQNYSWAELMKRVFEADVLACDRCGGRLRIVAAIHPPETTRKILDCLGLPSRPPPMSPPARETDISWLY